LGEYQSVMLWHEGGKSGVKYDRCNKESRGRGVSHWVKCG
jgi:hypothetical protein